MNYSDLKAIALHLKKTINCGTCKNKFADEDLYVISTVKNEGLFHLSCHNCPHQLLVHVSITYKKTGDTKQEEKKEILNIKTHTSGKIDTNEIIDMHIFLGKFNGDFKELFTK